MVNQIVFENEITLWWQEEEFLKTQISYKCYLNGKYHGETNKTHYTFSYLNPQQSYQIKIEAFEKGEYWYKEELTVSTAKAKNRLDVTKSPYDAFGDGKTLNTRAIQKALDDCTENDCVYIPKGTYLTGALNVHSNTEIYIEKDAVVQGTANIEDYLPKIKSRFEGIERMCYRSLLNLGDLDRNAGYNCKNVAIRGAGSLFGGGAALADNITEAEREELKEFLEKNAAYVKTCENNDTIPARARGRLINMSNCQNVVISGLTLGYGPSWNVHFIYSKNIVTYGCSIKSRGVWNGDGWDPDSSENCVLFDTTFDTHDNAVAIKSGKNPEGNIVNRPTKDVKIFDCRGTNDIAIGSELSGGVDGVYVWDCVFFDSWGINLKTTEDRGGYIKNVRVTNSLVSSVTIRTRIGCNNDGESSGQLTKIENLHFENLCL